jgi:hypothetical protein
MNDWRKEKESRISLKIRERTTKDRQNEIKNEKKKERERQSTFYRLSSCGFYTRWHLNSWLTTTCAQALTCAATMPSRSLSKSVWDQELRDQGDISRRSSENRKFTSWFFRNFRMFQGRSLCLEKEERQSVIESVPLSLPEWSTFTCSQQAWR